MWRRVVGMEDRRPPGPEVAAHRRERGDAAAVRAIQDIHWNPRGLESWGEFTGALETEDPRREERPVGSLGQRKYHDLLAADRDREDTVDHIPRRAGPHQGRR